MPPFPHKIFIYLAKNAKTKPYRVRKSKNSISMEQKWNRYRFINGKKKEVKCVCANFFHASPTLMCVSWVHMNEKYTIHDVGRFVLIFLSFFSRYFMCISYIFRMLLMSLLNKIYISVVIEWLAAIVWTLVSLSFCKH